MAWPAPSAIDAAGSQVRIAVEGFPVRQLHPVNEETKVGATDPRGDLLAKLAEGISGLTDSSLWLRHLECQSRFHRYSFGNVILIAAQRPDASRVAGYKTWRSLGRTVRKGQKAIWILAPMVAKRADGIVLGDDRVVRGFKYVPVFDISQTEGEELPAACHKLTGDGPTDALTRLTRVAQLLGYSVEDAELPDGVNGDCTFSLRRIRVESRNSSAQRVKTLAHEIAHAFLHADQPDRSVAELEAESVAYLVCQHLGLDTGDYTFGYVATWAGGGDEALAAIKTTGTNIQRTAHAMVDLLGDQADDVPSEAA
jgi:hypothetical protein